MGPLRLAAAAALLLASPASASPAIDRWAPYIAEASLRFGVPEAWIRRVMRAESGGHTVLNGRPITSHAGAMGLMQVMPRTYVAMARAHGLGSDPHAPRDNILAGTAYLRAMFDRYGYPGLFAAYNAGPGRYEQHLRTGRTLPQETRAYLAQLTGSAGRVPGPAAGIPPESAQSRARSDGLFFALRARSRSIPAPESPPRMGLFVAFGEPSARHE